MKGWLHAGRRPCLARARRGICPISPTPARRGICPIPAKSALAVTFALALSASALLSGCGHDAQSAIVSTLKRAPLKEPVDREATLVLKMSADQLSEMHLTTQTVGIQTIPHEVVLTGEVEPDANMTTPVISLVPGRVEAVSVQLGDAVRQGQSLAHLRSDDVAKIEADLLENVLSLEADMEQAQVQLELTKKVFQRHKQLFSEGISARADLDEAQSDYEKAQVALRSLKEKRTAIVTTATERLRLYGVDPAEVKRVLQTRTIDDTFDVISPRYGIVTSRIADTGQLIDNVHELFVVTDLRRVWLTAQAFEKDIKSIKKGQTAELTVNSYPGKKFSARLDYIGAVLDPDTRTMPVRVTIDNPEILLKPHMFATVRVHTGEDQALAIPFDAVQRTGEAYVAYVQIGKGRFMERKLELGRHFGAQVEVMKGLNPGDQLVVKGSLQLHGQMLKELAE
ncbi:MAG TPA: efflux RND transporter periplasmic adaptor subunit [Candidatus Obscuribacterales bacterium]